MKKLSATQTLNYIIGLFLDYLENLSKEPRPDEACLEREQFVSGERHAYVECLEIIQCWEHACKSGLNFNIEDKFPV